MTDEAGRVTPWLVTDFILHSSLNRFVTPYEIRSSLVTQGTVVEREQPAKETPKHSFGVENSHHSSLKGYSLEWKDSSSHSSNNMYPFKDE